MANFIFKTNIYDSYAKRLISIIHTTLGLLPIAERQFIRWGTIVGGNYTIHPFYVSSDMLWQFLLCGNIDRR